MANTVDNHRCEFCSFVSNSRKDVLKHLKDCHVNEPGFFLRCLMCSRKFKVFSSFTSHVSRCHPGVLVENAYESSKNHNESTGNDEMLLNDQQNSSDDPEARFVSQDISYSAGSFIIGLKEKHLVTQACIDYAVEGVTNLTESIVNVCKDKLQQVLNTADVDVNSICLDEVFTGDHCQPFIGLRTAYQQTEFVRNRLPYVKPVEISLGSRWVTSKSGKTAGKLILKEDKCIYISVIDTLKQLIKIDSVRNVVFESHISHDGLLRYIGDGWQSREHEVSSAVDFNFKILAYFDEVEVCNPLGSHTKVHKLGVFYFTLANFHPKCRSKLSSIYTFGVVKSSHLSLYGFNKILRPFVEDMKQLASGHLLFNVAEQEISVKGSLLLFLADTLAAHQLGGFKVGVGFALRKCRNCLATLEQMEEKFHHSMFLERTPELHHYHCSLLNGGLSSFNSTTYGVCYNSCLNEIPLFNVADWQLPQDVMHVLLEGVLPLIIKKTLWNLISVQNRFTVQDLNSRIESFPFGYSESKPSRIDAFHLTVEGNLRQSASQCWSLGRYLPLLVGDLVSNDDKFWECFLYLHDIVSICLSPCIAPMTISYLSRLISIHLGLFKECYPSMRITPKMHYMIHLPEQIRRFGPLVRYWCMRMEAKNAYAKKAASHGNFKNVPLSFAERHQRLLTYNLMNKDIMSIDISTGPGPASYPFANASANIMDLIRMVLPNVSDTDYLHRPTWLKVGRIEYRSGVVIPLGIVGVLPKFVIVKQLFYICSQPLVCVSDLVTLCLHEHNRSYVVSRSENELQYVLNLFDLPDYSVVYIHHSFSQNDHSSYICLKWNVEVL